MTRILTVVLAGLLSACGVVGAPVPPESIGVEPTVKQQQEQHEAMTPRQQESPSSGEIEDPYPALAGQDEDLPPLRPVGTR